MTAIHHNSSDFTPIFPANLPPAQAQVVAALAQGQTVTAAALAAGLHRTTIHHWLRTEPDFKTAVETAQREYVAVLNDEMRALSALSIKILHNLLEDPTTPPSIRLRAALAVLQRPGHDWSLPYPSRAVPSALPESEPDAASPVIQHPKSNIQDPPFTARCSPCPCGSGLKYKRCCAPRDRIMNSCPQPPNSTSSGDAYRASASATSSNAPPPS